MTVRSQGTKSKMLLSSYQGMPCPGGLYYQQSESYVKKLKLSSYFWPRKAFPIDSLIIEQLKKLGCRSLTLQITETGERYRISMEDFLAHATSIDWTLTDPRFPKRMYCPMEKWNKVAQERKAS